ncbi:lipase family protein [Paenibacillus sp. MBLB4367]|uniref:lipase family protein n=1 Tax=Paenibacillus sp. MBLB4367 TaxID=3384767 RepID=UPI003907F2FE
MSNTDPIDNRLAIFLAATCSQTYHQFADPDGGFVVPAGFTCAKPLTARAFGLTKERFGFILESDHDIIIAFRGTDSTADWISDMIARQSDFSYVAGAGATHRGFTKIYDSVRSQIHETLERMPHDKKLYITGHSLGGALATLCAFDGAYNTKFRQPIVYTYASPRVGDPTFAAAYNRTIEYNRRIVNEVDIVPLTPPQTYKPPKSDTAYRYLHVRGAHPLRFQKMSVSENHSITSYFNALRELDPVYAQSLCRRCPGFCPPK